ncbi:MAG: response regulator [Anaerolineae bacterium]
MNRFLVGESNPMHQSQIVKAFKQLGYSIDIVTNSTTLGKMMEREWYSHVLVDAKLPQFSCAEMTKYLKSSLKTYEAPTQLIAITANVFPAHWDEVLFDGSLAKPIDVENLQAMVEKTIVENSWLKRSLGVPV